VRHLPHQLVEAFRSTLEEVEQADLLLHVVDASHPDPASQLATVRQVVAEVGARGVQELVVFNKVDLADADTRMVLRGLEPTAVFVSARTGEGIERLQETIAALLPLPEHEVTAVVPFDRGDLVSLVHRHGRVLGTDYAETGTRLHALVGDETRAALQPYLV
jgi:GTP-binding protein HflX